jgi:hypothetical protein
MIPTAKSVNAGCCFWVICYLQYGDPAYRQGDEFDPRRSAFQHKQREERAGCPKHLATLTGLRFSMKDAETALYSTSSFDCHPSETGL